MNDNRNLGYIDDLAAYQFKPYSNFEVASMVSVNP